MSFLALLSFGFCWILNFGISWHNAAVVGHSWADARASKNTWAVIGLWSAFVMSGCGFSYCLLTPLVMALGAAGLMSQIYVLSAMKLGYLVIILPVIGSGLVIWLDSVTTAWRERDFQSTGIAAYNTYAQFHNMYTASYNISQFSGDLTKIFTSKDSDNGAIVLMVATVIIALGLGFLLTWKIVNDSAKEYGAGILDKIKKI